MPNHYHIRTLRNLRESKCSPKGKTVSSRMKHAKYDSEAAIYRQCLTAQSSPESWTSASGGA